MEQRSNLVLLFSTPTGPQTISTSMVRNGITNAAISSNPSRAAPIHSPSLIAAIIAVFFFQSRPGIPGYFAIAEEKAVIAREYQLQPQPGNTISSITHDHAFFT
jgi:hypothetical protein